MLRTSMLALFAFIAIVVSSQAYAQSLTLNPHESKQLTNHSMWTVNATCNVKGDVSRNKIRFSVLSNKGSVNGRTLSQGQATSVTLGSSDSITVSAEPGTTVNLVNLSTGSVHAVCNV